MIYHLSEVLGQLADEGAVIFEGFDDCIAGIASRNGSIDLVAYDFDLIIQKLMKEQNMTRTEAHEHFEYNMLGAWFGEGTPIILEAYKWEGQ